MEVDQALAIISEIATGDKEREAFLCIKEAMIGLLNDCDTYRSMYEGIQKRITHLRDIAGRPDLPYSPEPSTQEDDEGSGDEEKHAKDGMEKGINTAIDNVIKPVISHSS